MAADRFVFVTGAGRSGTTLLDRLLSSHPDAWVASQPLPLLHVEVKREYLRFIGSADDRQALQVPLADLFGDHADHPARFSAFVAEYQIPKHVVERVLASQEDYSGRYFAPASPRAILDCYEPMCLVDLVVSYLEAAVGTGRPWLIGAKETWCEEYIASYLAAGAMAVCVIRDPRDVLTSLHCGRGREFGGLPRPVLFVLRQWRKSVALALDSSDSPNFTAIRYEDLVCAPRETTTLLGSVLGLTRLGEHVETAKSLVDGGVVWPDNSSFAPNRQGLDPSGVGRYRHHLPRSIDLLVQACCYPELSCLGYPVDIGPDDVAGVLIEGLVDVETARPELAGYRWSPERAAEEVERWACFSGGRYEPRLCIRRRAFESMIEAVGSRRS